jgi:hypothetical protein
LVDRTVKNGYAAHALLAAQQGIVFLGRTGLDITTLTATARSLAAQLLPPATGSG